LFGAVRRQFERGIDAAGCVFNYCVKKNACGLGFFIYFLSLLTDKLEKIIIDRNAPLLKEAGEETLKNI
jgi:hypothetical protein